jgi:hypothetical protein
MPGGQVVRRHTLDVVTVGSNPTRAAKQKAPLRVFFCLVARQEGFEPGKGVGEMGSFPVAGATRL